MSEDAIVGLILVFTVLIPGLIALVILLYRCANMEYKLKHDKERVLQSIEDSLNSIILYQKDITDTVNACFLILDHHDNEDIDFTVKGGE